MIRRRPICKHRQYLAELGFLLKHRAIQAQQEWITAKKYVPCSTEVSRAFGRFLTFYGVIRWMQLSARGFHIPLHHLHLEDIDADKDLLSLSPASTKLGTVSLLTTGWSNADCEAEHKCEYRFYLHDLGYLLKEDALEAKQKCDSAEKDSEDYFIHTGEWEGFREVFRLMFQLAEKYQISLDELRIEDIDIDEKTI